MRLTRLGAITGLLALIALVVLLPSAGHTLDRLGSPSFPTALGAVLELALLAVCAWIVPVLGTCRLGGPAARLAVALIPRALRGLLVAGVVTGLTVGTAHADTSAPDPTPTAAPHEPGLSGLVLPDRPSPALAPSPTSTGPSTPVPEASDDHPIAVAPTVPPPQPTQPPAGRPDDGRSTTEQDSRSMEDETGGSTVVVRPGDSLWRIAAASLGPDARDVDIATATARWHRANQEVIGDDPDLLLPGQRLVAPKDVA